MIHQFILGSIFLLESNIFKKKPLTYSREEAETEEISIGSTRKKKKKY